MFIDTMTDFAELLAQRRSPAVRPDARRRPSALPGRGADRGSCCAAGATRLWNVHIEDMRRGVHDHLMFGEGEMDFRAGAADGAGRDRPAGGVHVELSRHSHDAVDTAGTECAGVSQGEAGEVNLPDTTKSLGGSQIATGFVRLHARAGSAACGASPVCGR